MEDAYKMQNCESANLATSKVRNKIQKHFNTQSNPMNVHMHHIFPETRVISLHFCHWYWGFILIQTFWWTPLNAFFLQEYQPFTVIRGHWF